MGIRTPDLLHAIQRQTVHHSIPVQVTVLPRPLQSTRVQACCGTFLLYRSARLDRASTARAGWPTLLRDYPYQLPGDQELGARPADQAAPQPAAAGRHVPTASGDMFPDRATAHFPELYNLLHERDADQ
jgi:hypothetical protein